jgi:DMSO/TMAO reductase YedYZ molybdopterin-dependent catalytic subunit
MQRRQFLKTLLTTTGGLIGATLLPGCGRKIDPLFLQDLLNPQASLPDHVTTPLSEFYVQSYALPPRVNADTWQLEITGLVEKPRKLSLSDILAAPQSNFYLTMECIGNPAGGNLIGNAQWTGTPLLPFLEAAGIQPEVKELMLHAADSYETTLPLSDLLRPDVHLVHAMNGAPLTQSHGYPLRILIPGHFGQKQPKWLIKIEAIAQAKLGYWERQGWSNTAEIPTHSLIRQVQQTRVWDRQAKVSLSNQVNLSKTGDRPWSDGILIAGVALDAFRSIQRIQISTDNGSTWQTADQNRPDSAHEWTLWRYAWRPTQPGTYTLLARAETDRSTQPLDDVNRKDGSSAPLKIQVTLQS